MILALTKKCNIACYMCNVHYKKGVLEEYPTMSSTVFSKIEPFFPFLKQLTLGGNGEPFIDKDIFHRLDRIRHLNKAVFIEVFTNGLLLDSPTLVREAVHAIDMFRFSINAFSKNNYESIMVGGKYDKLLHNLAVFKQVRNDAGMKIKTSVECIIMKRNISDIDKSVEFCRELGFDSLVFKPMWIIDDRTKEEFIKPEDAEADILRELLPKVRHLGMRTGIEVEIYDEIFQLYFNRDKERRISDDISVVPVPKKHSYWGMMKNRITRNLANKSVDYEKLPCSDPWNTIQIFENGSVLLCCQGLTPIGDLKESSIEEIWNGEEAQRYRRGMISGEYYGACRNCNRIVPRNLASYEKAITRKKE
ncbi:MAG: radical SAM protein [Syntrophaceae bacterium]|nr:radical SAM protein [Syntrophaceae bacterium]